MRDNDLTMPKVSLRFAKEIFNMVSDELYFSVDNTIFKDDLTVFLDDLDTVIKDYQT